MVAGMTKQDIRTMSREFGLPTADLPASPCLASRLSYGLEVTSQRLKEVEQAEEMLRGLGFREFRVRHHGTIARIEVNPSDFQRIIADPVRVEITRGLTALGFRYVALDLQGFRSGSLNEVLTDAQKRPNR